MGIKTLVRKAKRGFALRIFLHITKGLAKGKYGRGPQKVWLGLEGFKTYLGLVFVVAGFTFGEAFNLGVCDQCPAWNQILMTGGVVLAQIGLLDGANREDGPNAADPFLCGKCGETPAFYTRGGTQG